MIYLYVCTSHVLKTCDGRVLLINIHKIHPWATYLFCVMVLCSATAPLQLLPTTLCSTTTELVKHHLRLLLYQNTMMTLYTFRCDDLLCQQWYGPPQKSNTKSSNILSCISKNLVKLVELQWVSFLTIFLQKIRKFWFNEEFWWKWSIITW